MSLAVVVAVFFVCVSALTAWVLWLRHAQWLQLNRNTARDELAATVEGRLLELERRAKSWAK